MLLCYFKDVYFIGLKWLKEVIKIIEFVPYGQPLSVDCHMAMNRPI